MALDEEDLAVLSAHAQDALVPARDFAWLPKERRFALVLSRFDWDGFAKGRRERVIAGLHFDRVSKVSSIGFDRRDPELLLELLAIGFVPDQAPGGSVLLTFSGGAALKLDVECLEAQMQDVGPRWVVDSCPEHKLDDAPDWLAAVDAAGLPPLPPEKG
ncbi:MAG: DUF2948 family protein [Rhodoblastus sp.]|nr:MAG: DUF2948 family protein [Rhodoblastus sp.]